MSEASTERFDVVEWSRELKRKVAADGFRWDPKEFEAFAARIGARPVPAPSPRKKGATK